MHSLFIFTRDLRVVDNTTLYLCKNSVIPIFVFNPDQVIHNEYKSNNCVQIMCESLMDLNDQLGGTLNLFEGRTEDIVEQIALKYQLDGVYINKDYTPYAKNREHKLNKLCKTLGINFICEHDYMLAKIDKPYLKFTPYYNNASKKHVKKPVEKTIKYQKIVDHKIDVRKYYTPNPDIAVHGGRENGLRRMKEYNFSKYEDVRNYYNEQSSMMSAYLKFNVISIRELYHHVKLSAYRRELYWRDFYMQLIDNNEVLGKSMRDNKIIWENDPTIIKKWKNGKLGVKIIDDAMINLVKTGFMHNRLRMIVANYLTKKLKVDWMIGEKFFAQNLMDYDPASNNGGWQWSAGTGVDSFNRVFNPALQEKKYGNYKLKK